MLALKFLAKFKDFGLLVMRLGIGLSFIMHGSQKMFGGVETWTQVGSSMTNFGMNHYHYIWGFLAAFAEFGGGIFLILGFLTRPAAIMMWFTMVVATTMHVLKGDGFQVYSHALEMSVVFFALIFVGPGRFSIDQE
ncbi:MAG: DoxX family protein [Proteobacteria bacterium]|nr:MAG: DoxX family protein [Pseudomonadota bacterium]